MFGFSEDFLKEVIQFSLDHGGPKGAHITRFSMYRALQDVLARQDGPRTRVLSVGASASFGREVLGLREAVYTEANHPEFDVLSLPFESESFDACISDQVLEHVEGDPVRAFRETARLVVPGGYLCHTTCFFNPVHGAPKDFWRFTPDALRLMAGLSGCATVQAGGWGNREAWALMEAGFRFAAIPTDPAHPLHRIATRNEPGWPVTVWILARKG